MRTKPSPVNRSLPARPSELAMPILQSLLGCNETSTSDKIRRYKLRWALLLKERVQLMRRRSAQYTLCVCIGAVMFTGCSAAANVTPPPSVGFAQSTAKLVALAIPASSTQPARSDNETINGTGGQSKVPYCGLSGRGEGYVSVSESGSAIVPYPGTFTDSGTFFARCEQSLKTTASGSFSITSGASKISGSFYGPGTGGCGRHPWGQTCTFNGNSVTYSASLIRGGKVRRQFSGNASVTIGTILSSSHMNLTLKGL
jgi:hypothetical protein